MTNIGNIHWGLIMSQDWTRHWAHKDEQDRIVPVFKSPQSSEKWKNGKSINKDVYRLFGNKEKDQLPTLVEKDRGRERSSK